MLCASRPGSQTRLPPVRRRLLWLCSAFLCVVVPAAGARAANDVALTPSGQSIPIDTLATLSLAIAFDDTTLGGGIVVSPGSGLAFDSFVFDAGFPDTPALRLVCPDAGEPACDDFAGPGILIAFGDLGGLSGAATVGTLFLKGTSPGVSSIALAEDEVGGVAGPFEPTPGGQFAAPTFSGAGVEVIQLVPALGGPAALALAAVLLTLGAAASLRRRSRSATRAWRS